MTDSHLVRLADGLTFYLRHSDHKLCMVRHFVFLGQWKLSAAASEADVLAHIHEIESCSDNRLGAELQHHRFSSTQQKHNATIIIDVDRTPVYDSAEELQIQVPQALLTSKRMVFKKKKGAAPSQEGRPSLPRAHHRQLFHSCSRLS